MPIPAPGLVDMASQATSVAIKAKTDIIGASVALEAAGNLAAVKAKTDMMVQYCHIPLYPMRGKAVAGTWAYILSASVTSYIREIIGVTGVPGYMVNTTDALNDEYAYPKISLFAGDYSIEVIHTNGGGNGILTIRHGAALLGTVDLYAGVGAFNIYHQVNFSIAADAVASIRLIAESKNGASAGYQLPIQSVILWRRT